MASTSLPPVDTVTHSLQEVKGRLIAGTNAISLDEWAWSLKETNAPTPDSKGVHRYQTIIVVRNGHLTEFRHDLGAANRFKVSEFVIPGGVVDEATGRGELLHTVGELYDIAEHLRLGPYEHPETPKPGDLIALYHDQPDKRRRAAKALSQFGPSARIQRS